MTDQNEADDPMNVIHLKADEREQLIEWIRSTFAPAARTFKYSSYYLKHSFEADTRVYVDNGAFKGAMLLCGFLPNDSNAQNPTYRVVPKREIKQGT